MMRNLNETLEQIESFDLNESFFANIGASNIDLDTLQKDIEGILKKKHISIYNTNDIRDIWDTTELVCMKHSELRGEIEYDFVIILHKDIDRERIENAITKYGKASKPFMDRDISNIHMTLLIWQDNDGIAHYRFKKFGYFICNYGRGSNGWELSSLGMRFKSSKKCTMEWYGDALRQIEDIITTLAKSTSRIQYFCTNINKKRDLVKSDFVKIINSTISNYIESGYGW